MADTNNEATSPAPAALIVKGIPVGVPVPVDAELDPTSDNPVSNAAVCGGLDDIFKPDIYDSYPGLQLIKFGPIVVAVFRGYVPLNNTLTIPEKYRPSAERTGGGNVTIMGLLYAGDGSNYVATADIFCATGKVDIGYKDSVTTRSHTITSAHGFYGNGVWVTD